MTLSETWFMEGYIDYELQKYRLLAYLDEVKRSFSEVKLYPQLSDMVFHYNNMVAFQNSKRFLQDQFPKKMSGLDTRQLEVIYERMLTDDDLMRELEQIADFAIEEIRSTISEGTGIHESVEQQMRFEPVGIIPLYNNEGYLFLRCGGSDTRVYNYTVSIFEHKDAKYKGIKMQYLDTRPKNIANTYEQIKLDVIRANRALPNPAVYVVESALTVPFDETLLPVAKRMLIRHVGEA